MFGHSVRVRVTASAVIATAIGVVALAVAVVVLFEQAQTDRLRTAANAEAQRVAEQLESGRTPVLDVPDVGAELQLLVQVIDEAGYVVLSNARPPVAEPGLPTRPFDRQFRRLDDAQVATSRRVTTADGDRTVVVASPLARVVRSVEMLRTALFFGSPLLLLLVGAVAWTAVGRALSPIERMRAEVTDISSRTLDRRLEPPRTADEIERLARTMNDLLDRVETASKRQREFVADASHELRSPLAAVRTLLEVALAGGPAAWEAALDEVARLEQLVDDLLLLARLEEGDVGGRWVDVDLDELVEEETLRLRGVTVLTERVSGGRVTGSRRQLASVVRNLLDNAARHARSTVAVEVRADGAEILFTVEDDGAGIAAEDRERVFARFTRLDPARDRGAGGVGLGLALTRRVVEHHGGTITIGEAALGGARVEVRLPGERVEAPVPAR